VRNGTYLEMDKDAFVRMLKEAEILILPKPKEEVKAAPGRGRGAPKATKAAEEKKVEEEEKPKEEIIYFKEEDAMKAIEPCQSFDFDMLNYYDFLEALCRVAEVYPFTKVQLLDDMETFENRVDFLCSKLETKNFDLMQKFEMER
jgi:hypothetical protein